MPLKAGVYTNRKKDGSVSYRSSITFRSKHISLGSYPSESEAHVAYCEAQKLLYSEDIAFDPAQYEQFISSFSTLSFSKCIILYNFKTTGFYFKTPILLTDKYFLYFLTRTIVLKFDVDDLFYYSTHSISKRGGHLYVSDYGMQINILSKYGIKNFAVPGRDYRFINGDCYDFRYKNIEVINKYYGVQKKLKNGQYVYDAVIHINGNYKIGSYKTEAEAAVAYNKAVNILKEKGIEKNYLTNYLIELDEISYASLYHKIRISKNIRDF